MTLQEQIEYTYSELKSYEENKFSNPEIVKWLRVVLASLTELQDLREAIMND